MQRSENSRRAVVAVGAGGESLRRKCLVVCLLGEQSGGQQVVCSRAEQRASPPVSYSASGGYRRTAKTPIMRFLLRAGVKSGPCRGVNALGRGRGSFSAPCAYTFYRRITKIGHVKNYWIYPTSWTVVVVICRVGLLWTRLRGISCWLQTPHHAPMIPQSEHCSDGSPYHRLCWALARCQR